MMPPHLATFVQALRFGNPQTASRLTIIPVLGAEPTPLPDYESLAEALQHKQVDITEVSQGGSVPDLAVTNSSDKPVLLLDGEELAGAKQNRVLNTTILIAAGIKTVIPVSCSEHGRWSYTSDKFSSSGHVMASAIRKKKSRSVSASLDACAGYTSNQGEVWDEIAQLHEKASTAHFSKTGAMSDVYEARQKELDELADSFPVQPGQTGMIVLRNGRVEGCDVLSRPEVYRQLHGRLVRSYALDALVDEPPNKEESTDSDPSPAARAFLASAGQAETTPHRSVGLGEDHRFRARQLAGSALVVDGQVIHMALFADHDGADEKDKPLASVQRRRRYRGF